MQYFETPTPAGVGIREEQIHVASGLRNVSLNAVISSSLGSIFVAAGGVPSAIGDGAPLIDNGWPQGFRSRGAAWNPMAPVPMTPTATFYVVPAAVGPFPQTVQVQIRVKGTNQFGAYQEEVTPYISKVMTTASQWFMVHLSKVFATVDEAYVRTINVNAGGNFSQVAMGWCTVIDPTMVGAAAFTSVGSGTYLIGGGGADSIWEIYHGGVIASTNLDLVGTAANWGVGAGLIMQPFGPPTPFPSPEINGATAVILREKSTPTVLNTVARLPARGQLSVAGAAPVTGVCIGRSAAGFQGEMSKFGFFSTDAWTTKIAGINLGGSSSRAAGVPTLEAQVGEDELQLTAWLRTTIGTKRGANATRTYPNG